MKMGLKEEIQQDLKEAAKERKELESVVLRTLLAAVLNREKEKRYKITVRKPEAKEEELERESRLTDEEIIEVVSSEAKKRKEAAAEYEKGQRPELAEKEKRELEILQKYMPDQLSEEEIKKLAKEAVEEVSASSSKDMGKVMAYLMPKIKGRADGGAVSGAVKELLSPQ